MTGADAKCSRSTRGQGRSGGNLIDRSAYRHWMARIPPEEIGGVGLENARKLGALGCESTADVRNLDIRFPHKAMTMVGDPTARGDVLEPDGVRRRCV